MKIFKGKGKVNIVLILVFTMMIQILVPSILDVTFAEEDGEDGETQLEVMEGKDPGKADPEVKEPEEDAGITTSTGDDTEKEEGEELEDEDVTTSGILEANVGSGSFAIQSSGLVEANLLSSFSMTIIDKGGVQTVINNGHVLEVDLNNINSALINYGLTKPNDVTIRDGDQYAIYLPAFFEGTATDKPIIIDGTTVATYSIVGGQIIITFNEAVNDLDDVEMFIGLSGNFDTKVFDHVEEVVVNLPFRDDSSFTATIRAKQQDYEGQDKKTAGSPYVLDNGNKVTVTSNPTHVYWTVIANDNMETYSNATIVDDLGENLEIVEGSFKVYRILRNYNNVEIGREEVNVTPTITGSGFELDLGAINDAYEITYTTELIRPDGGGQKTINNTARIILDGDEVEVSDSFKGTWSGDIPTIVKDGKLSDNPHIINWEVKYNFGKEDLGTVTLTDTLTHGEVDLETVKVYEVNVDIEGDITGKTEITEFEPGSDADDNLTFPGLDAKGKAYLITFSSKVPVGLKGEVTNTIIDDLDDPNSDSDKVDVNTIPTGGKVGEQKVDKDGNPYIEWIITMNSNKVDVGSITVRDVFSKEHLEFDTKDSDLYELYRDGEEVTDFTITDYTHEDSRTGFKLDISEAGPHTYEFFYRTYYTVAGMQEPKLANHAELVFLDGDRQGIGDPISVDIDLDGPKAGIHKSGRYITSDDKKAQEIEWTITFNQSNIMLDSGTTLTDAFTSENYEYIKDSLVVTADGSEPAYTFTEKDKGFTITLDEGTKSKITVKYRTTTADNNQKNEDHINEATLKWQGGEETSPATVGLRHPGSNKSGEVVINDDGTKTVNWTINFNTNKNIIHNFKIEDNYTPTSVTVSNIKITSGEKDVTNEFTISDESTGGTFTVTNVRLDAKAYQLTYSTTLSAEEEQAEIKNTANITYTGGSENPEATIDNPELGVKKEANGINREPEKPVISWTIQANTDAANKHVNLVDAVLEDTIPADQRLIQDSIKVYRTDNLTAEVTELSIETDENSFSIKLPDGPYQYKVTFDTEILQMPSLDPELFDRYNNYTTLTNQTNNESLKQEDEDDAWIRYYKDVENDLTGKSGKQNPDTENIDYEVTINPEGLTIHNAKVTDSLSSNHQYVENSIKVMDAEDNELASGYTLTVAEDKRSFEIVFKEDVKDEADLGTINQPYKISYSTRLNANLIGTYDVTNSIILTGGTKNTELKKTEITSPTQQWFYGGGGRGRLAEFELKKVNNVDNPLQGVKFKIERLDFNGDPIEKDTRTLITDINGIIKSGQTRAGRYKLTEETPKGYEDLGDPIYIILGYSNSDSDLDNPYVVTITDKDGKESVHSNTAATENILTVVNNLKTSAVGLEANKVLKGQNLREGQFEFELKDSEKNVLQTKKNNAEGQIIFDAMDFADKDEGTYKYTISEKMGSQTGIGYDRNVYNVIVKVDQSSKIEVKYFNAQGDDIEEVEFVNTYNPLTPSTSLKDVTGTKVWSGGPDERPTIQLQLYKDGVAEGNPVILKDGETQHTWYNLIERTGSTIHEYSVDEVNVPEDYEKTISEDGLTITNTYIDPEEPEEPIDPEDPEDPDDPEEPEEPTGPTDPTDPPILEGEEYEDPKDPKDPSDPPLLEGEGYENDPDPNKNGGKDGLPKTGQSNNIILPILGIILLAAGFVLRKRKTN